jgi:hypothetical protein
VIPKLFTEKFPDLFSMSNSQGGAIYAGYDCTAKIHSCVFESNEAVQVSNSKLVSSFYKKTI